MTHLEGSIVLRVVLHEQSVGVVDVVYPLRVVHDGARLLVVNRERQVRALGVSPSCHVVWWVGHVAIGFCRLQKQVTDFINSH